MDLSDTISRMREFHQDRGWKPIMEAYQIEKGLPKDFTFTEDDKKELASRFAKHLTNGGN